MIGAQILIFGFRFQVEQRQNHIFPKGLVPTSRSRHLPRAREPRAGHFQHPKLFPPGASPTVAQKRHPLKSVSPRLPRGPPNPQYEFLRVNMNFRQNYMNFIPTSENFFLFSQNIFGIILNSGRQSRFDSDYRLIFANLVTNTRKLFFSPLFRVRTLELEPVIETFLRTQPSIRRSTQVDKLLMTGILLKFDCFDNFINQIQTRLLISCSYYEQFTKIHIRPNNYRMSF